MFASDCRDIHLLCPQACCGLLSISIVVYCGGFLIHISCIGILKIVFSLSWSVEMICAVNPVGLLCSFWEGGCKHMHKHIYNFLSFFMDNSQLQPCVVSHVWMYTADVWGWILPSIQYDCHDHWNEWYEENKSRLAEFIHLRILTFCPLIQQHFISILVCNPR